VSLLSTDLHTPASAYTPYFAPLTTRLNKAFPVGDSPWDLFKPAPNETQLLVHSIPLAFLPSADDQLFPCLDESIRNARGVSILSACYLNPDPESREQKRATSVVVTVAPPDAFTILPSIKVFSRNRRVEQRFCSSKNSLCKKCWKFRHVSNRCSSSLPVCPICSLAHTKAEHRCPNPSCPKGGNILLILACCPSSMARCPNCQEEHSACSRDCPSRPKATPDAPKVLSRQTKDSLHLAEDKAGPLTVVHSARDAPPHTPSPPVRSCDALPPRQSAHRTITDLAPRESGDESLDSHSSEGSAQIRRTFFTWYTDSRAIFPSFPIVQHNRLGIWDVFLSLFPSFTMLPHPSLLVAIQDPPSRRSVLPTFPGFLSFGPRLPAALW